MSLRQVLLLLLLGVLRQPSHEDERKKLRGFGSNDDDCRYADTIAVTSRTTTHRRLPHLPRRPRLRGDPKTRHAQDPQEGSDAAAFPHARWG